jgi:hypothetical protein
MLWSLVGACTLVATHALFTSAQPRRGGRVCAADAGRSAALQHAIVLHSSRSQAGSTSALSWCSEWKTRMLSDKVLMLRAPAVVHTNSLRRLRDGSGIRSVTPVMVSTPADRAQQRNDSAGGSGHAQPIRHVLFSA